MVSEWCDSCMSFWLLGVEEECGGGGVRVFSLHFSLLRFAPTKSPGGDRFICRDGLAKTRPLEPLPELHR